MGVTLFNSHKLHPTIKVDTEKYLQLLEKSFVYVELV